MMMWQRFVTAALVSGSFTLSLFSAGEEPTGAEDSSAALPKEYANKYLVAESTLSPDKNIAVIYPKLGVCFDEGKDVMKEQCKDYLVMLQPFQILCTLDTKWPHFENKNHGGISAAWSKDSSVALVTLDNKWGPGDIFLYELRDGKLSRSTNLLAKIHQLLVPDFQKAKPPRYNDYFDFIFEGDSADLCRLEGTARIRINALATTDPKHISGTKAWDARMEGVWDIPQARFTSQKVTRLFAGVRKDE